MFHDSLFLFLLCFTICFFSISCSSHEFSLGGDYLLGGLFALHKVDHEKPQSTPEAIECSRHTISVSGYQMLQVMRFAVEEINNSTTILPNVSLGYEIFDHCTATKNFPAVFSFISQNGSIKPKEMLNNHQPEVIALTGPYGSKETVAIASLLTSNLIPIVSYGASSYVLSNKLQYPSILRTVPSNKDLIQMIIRIIQWFGWNWVAFIGSQDNYSEDGLKQFNKNIINTDICLAYQDTFGLDANYSLALKKIDMLKINVIVVFAMPQNVKKLIKAAIANNIRGKVWIAGETWSMDKQLSREPGIEKIGRIIGITEKLLSLPGFDEFIFKAKGTSNVHNNVSVEVQSDSCNQACKRCSLLTAEEIINENPTFSFAIYAAIYTIAQALHNVLQCGLTECHKNTTVRPYMLLGEMKKVDFSLNGHQVKYDDNGDPTVNYAIVLWDTKTNPPQFNKVGTYDTYPEITFTINSSLIPWRDNGSVPFSNCSHECKEGYSREREGLHDCCFRCKKCPKNSYVNKSRDPYTCFPCAESDWSAKGSTRCKTRSVVYLEFTEIPSIIFMVSVMCLMLFLIAIFCLFAYNHDTPVVKSAGGSMCLLMLACLIMSNISLFFFFGDPTSAHCILRHFAFKFFFTVCLSCLTVRAFQIVCIFKMAAKFPNLHSLWVKHNGQWLFIIFSTVVVLIACMFWVIVAPPKPIRDTLSFKDQVMLICENGNTISYSIIVSLSWFLGFLCLVFSYMGRDLPKNYNEAKSITFGLVLFYASWTAYFTAVLSVKSKYIVLFNAIAQLASINAIFFSYFIPKSYIIIFKPKKNTTAYFQTSIQNYTQTIGRT
ncbi:taste receptor type 1 member 1-like [Xyrauchen texanus]|uniref:taste receptor type 1 member 1-like n=1 Tax=Xyrauchen texanus TaxID=154827 RepID=UPI002242373A|nr:taste receptor type 1 member 1-like [Xyrauchen texanus]